MQLHERYRPSRLDHLIGNAAVVQRLQFILQNQRWDRDAFWIEGPSGTGKTTLARLLAARVCDDPYDIAQLDGADCDVERVRWLQDTFGYASYGAGGWRAAIVDEANAMTPKAVQAWKTFLEPLPRRRLVCFTSARPLCPALFGIEAEQLASRCKILRLERDLDAITRWLLSVAQAESIPCTPDQAEQLVAEEKGNLRALLQRLELRHLPDLRRKPTPHAAAIAGRIAATLAR